MGQYVPLRQLEWYKAELWLTEKLLEQSLVVPEDVEEVPWSATDIEFVAREMAGARVMPTRSKSWMIKAKHRVL